MCFSCEWCEEIKNRPLLADDMIESKIAIFYQLICIYEIFFAYLYQKR